MARMCEMAKGNILVAVPRVSLIGQTAEKLRWVVDDVGIHCASLNRKDLKNQFIVSTLQSARNINAKFKTIIIDEAHLMKKSVSHLIKSIEHEYVVGLTGTPMINGQKIYGDDEYWNEPCATVTIKELTKLGYLTPLRIGCATEESKVDLTGVATQRGDYVVSQLFEKYEPMIAAQVNETLEKTKDRKAVLIMCINIQHAEIVYSLLPENESALIHSKLKDVQHKIDQFRSGLFKYLVSVAQISVGFDAPIADTLALMRATRSTSLFVQVCGRILRMHDDKKDALLLDFGRVVENLGSPYDITPEGDKTKDPLELVCITCNTYNRRSCIKCTECGHHFSVMCDICHNVRLKGTPCPNECNKRNVTLANSLKNLTNTAFKRQNKIYNVRPRFDYYTSKAGNKCIRINYGGFISEYFTERMAFKFKKRLQVLELNYTVDLAELNKNSLHIKVEVNYDGKYPRVHKISK